MKASRVVTQLHTEDESVVEVSIESGYAAVDIHVTRASLTPDEADTLARVLTNAARDVRSAEGVGSSSGAAS